MKSLLITALSLFLFGMAHAQGVSLKFFEVKNIAGNIHVAWGVNNEAGVSEYRLYKKVGSEIDYSYVTTMTANGAGDYQFTDPDLFKDAVTLISYELRVMRNGATQKFYAALTYNSTSVQRTWGSIKSMFK